MLDLPRRALSLAPTVDHGVGNSDEDEGRLVGSGMLKIALRKFSQKATSVRHARMDESDLDESDTAGSASGGDDAV